MNRDLLIKTRKREAAALAELHKERQWHIKNGSGVDMQASFNSAVQWREKRIAAIDANLADLEKRS